MSDSSSSLKQRSTSKFEDTYEISKAEEQLFGRPYAYTKKRKAGVSFTLFFAGLIVVLIAIIDFLLATNIIIWVRTLDTTNTKDVFQHSAVVCISVLMIWLTYRFLVWYVLKFHIKETIQNNKLYQRIANDVVELENLLVNNDDGEGPSRRND